MYRTVRLTVRVTLIQDMKMKVELGNTLIELCKTVPSGVVVFFTSYKQEAAFYDLWQKNGLLQKLEAQKTIFREPKKTSDVDELLEKYGKRKSLTSFNYMNRVPK